MFIKGFCMRLQRGSKPLLVQKVLLPKAEKFGPNLGLGSPPMPEVQKLDSNWADKSLYPEKASKMVAYKKPNNKRSYSQSALTCSALQETEPMDLSSWFRRSLSSTTSKNTTPDPPKQSESQPEEQEELLGVTEQLIDFIRSFTFDTFKNFPPEDDEEAACGDVTPTTSGNVRKDLSEWQERHAILVISKVKEISQLRYMLCPRHLKERQFWRIYFKLVKSYVAKYELHAIQRAKLKQRAIEDEKSSDTCTYEVEMAEANHAESLESPPR